MSSAILLIAHGSRRPAANADLVRLAELVAARRPEDLVEIAYLELASPSIPEGLNACVQRGATSIRMAPFFLSSGAHVATDLHEFRREFLASRPHLDVQICPPIGLHPLVVEIILDRLNEAGAAPVESDDAPVSVPPLRDVQSDREG